MVILCSMLVILLRKSLNCVLPAAVARPQGAMANQENAAPTQTTQRATRE